MIITLINTQTCITNRHMYFRVLTDAFVVAGL